MTHLIREISIKDVENFISLLSQIYDESEFTFYNPGEYSPTISSASQHLENTSPHLPKQYMSLKVMSNLLDTYLLILKLMNVHSTKLWCTLVLENITNIKVLDKHLSIELKHGL